MSTRQDAGGKTYHHGDLRAQLSATVVGVRLIGLDNGAFWGNMQSSVELAKDFGGGLFKGAVFGFLVSWLAVYFGWSATPTSEGVALATTQTVITSAIAVLLIDFVMSAFML